MASEKCVQECLTILRLMKGDKWESAHAGFYGATLKAWPDEIAKAVVNRCADTMTFRPSRAELLSTLQASDGRPGPEEAWGMIPKSENDTAVLTTEMLYASNASQPLLDGGDKVAARMAFKERYVQLVAEARAEGAPVDWQISLGYDKAGREGPIREAVVKGRLAPAKAQRFIPMELPGEPPLLLESAASRMPVTIKELAGKKALKRESNAQHTDNQGHQRRRDAPARAGEEGAD